MNENEIKNIEEIENGEVFTEEEISTLCQNSKTQYLQEIGRIPLLTREEETAAFERYKNGDSSMKTYIVEHNLKLVVSVAFRILGKGYNNDDLLDYIQEGNLGLMKAVDKYNENHESGVCFSSYAYYWIFDGIIRAVQSSGIVRIPVYVMETVNKVKRFMREFEVQNGYVPSTDEIVNATGIAKEKVEEALKQLSPKTVSLEECTDTEDENGKSSLYGILEQTTFDTPESSIEKIDLKNQIAEMLSHLTDTERAVIELAYGFTDGEEKTYQEIGDILGFSKQRANTLCKRALEKLYGMRAKLQFYV